jgi:exonuclease VII large subunit
MLKVTQPLNAAYLPRGLTRQYALNAVYRDGAIVNKEVFMSDGLSQELDQVSEVPVNTAAPKPQNQDEINRAVQARLAREREKHEQEIAQLRAQMQQSSLPTGVGAQGLTREDVEAMLESKMRNVIETAGQKAMAQKLFGDFNSRIEAHPEIKQQMIEEGISDFPELIPLSLAVDNTAEVIKELLDKPLVANNLVELYKKNPAKAKREISRLSQSIKDNQSAKIVKPKEPLSQVKASTTAVDSGGQKGVRDYFEKYRKNHKGF